MNEQQTFVCLEEQKELQEFLGLVKELIKDSDVAVEKQMVQNFLQQVSEAVTFFAIRVLNISIYLAGIVFERVDDDFYLGEVLKEITVPKLKIRCR